MRLGDGICIMKLFKLFGIVGLLSVFGPSLGQNVGIGTSQPTSKLHVYTESSSGLKIETGSATGLSSLQFAVRGQVLQSISLDAGDGGKVKFSTSDQLAGTYMTLSRNGFVGIGTTQPAHNLHVSGTRPGTYVGYFQNQSPNGPALGAYSDNSYNAVGGVAEHSAGIGVYGVHLPIDGNGWGVWGTSNSSDGIGVRGTVPTDGDWLGFGGYFSGGLAYVNGLYNLSDGRLKTNVQPLSGALQKVNALEGVSFQYDAASYPEFVGQDNRTYLGFVAQQVQSVVPEVVAEKSLIGQNELLAKENARAEMFSNQLVKVVDYSALVPLLVEAIKEQQLLIKSLEERIDQLESND